MSRSISAGTMLAPLPLVLPTVPPHMTSSWHLYVVRVESRDGTPTRRDQVLAKLNAEGIGAGIHYPIPVHLTPAFAGLGHGPGSFPHAERAANEILSLPIFPQITAEQQDRVVRGLASALAEV